MFSRCAWEYIISYRLTSHKKTLAGLDIELFTNIYFQIIKKMVKDIKTHRCALEFDSLFLRSPVKEKKHWNKTTNLYVITHQSVNIWWCIFITKILENDKKALLLTNEDYFHGIKSVMQTIKVWIGKPVIPRHLYDNTLCYIDVTHKKKKILEAKKSRVSSSHLHLDIIISTIPNIYI